MLTQKVLGGATLVTGSGVAAAAGVSLPAGTATVVALVPVLNAGTKTWGWSTTSGTWVTTTPDFGDTWDATAANAGSMRLGFIIPCLDGATKLRLYDTAAQTASVKLTYLG